MQKNYVSFQFVFNMYTAQSLQYIKREYVSYYYYFFNLALILPLFLNYQILILGKLFIWENMVENIFFGKGKVTWHEIRQGIPQWSLIISISEAHFSAIFIPSAPIGFYRALKVEIWSNKKFQVVCAILKKKISSFIWL